MNAIQIQIIFLYHDTMQAEMASKITTQKSFNTHSFYFLLPNFSQLYIPPLLDYVSVLLHYYWEDFPPNILMQVIKLPLIYYPFRFHTKFLATH